MIGLLVVLAVVGIWSALKLRPAHQALGQLAGVVGVCSLLLVLVNVPRLLLG